MKALLIVLVLLTSGGCATNHYKIYDAEGKTTTELYQVVWFQKTAAKGMKVSPKTGFSLNGFENETQEDVVGETS
jgi:hypothetical protein